MNDAEDTGCECRRFMLASDETAFGTVVGDIDRAGEVVPELGPEPAGGLEGTSAHAATVSGKKPPELDHEFFVEGSPSLLSSSGVEAVRGLGTEEALAMTESGGRIEKIWFSDCGGPYESKGSGMVWSIGSITGSELKERSNGLPGGKKLRISDVRFRSKSVEDVHRRSHDQADLPLDEIPHLLFVLNNLLVVSSLELIQLVHLFL